MDRRLVVLPGFAVVLAATVVIVLVARGGESDGGSISTDTNTKPDVAAPGGNPLGELEVEDVIEGDGETAKSGDEVEVEYVGVDFESGEEFDSSWERE